MTPEIFILVVSFVILLAIHTPVAFAIGISAILALYCIGEVPAAYICAQRMNSGIASFPMLAIPFFILAGNLMGQGGMARRLIEFASALVGRYPGGLSYVSTITCMMFGAISGSATAAVSSIGAMLMPEMVRNGYDRNFSVAVTTTAATTGLVIPPSNIMIIYAVVTGNVSVAAMFMAGILPGILIGLCIMVVGWFISSKRNYRGGDVSDWSDVIRTGIAALPSLALIVIVLWGILAGAFSATEAAAIAVLYAFVVAVLLYREVKLTDIPSILLKTGITTSVVFFLIATSSVMSWVMAYLAIPQTVSELLLGLSDNPYVLFALMNLLLLCVGTFMDMTPAVLIFTPVFLPVAVSLGMHPVHFGIMMITNLCIGLCTPPVGTCLFLGCSVGKTTIAKATKPMLPFFAAMLIALLVITYFPPIVMWLPNVLGLN